MNRLLYMMILCVTFPFYAAEQSKKRKAVPATPITESVSKKLQSVPASSPLSAPPAHLSPVPPIDGLNLSPLAAVTAIVLTLNRHQEHIDRLEKEIKEKDAALEAQKARAILSEKEKTRKETKLKKRVNCLAAKITRLKADHVNRSDSLEAALERGEKQRAVLESELKALHNKFQLLEARQQLTDKENDAKVRAALVEKQLDLPHLPIPPNALDED